MGENTRSIFSGMHILHEGNWLKSHAVIVDNGVIKAIIPDDMIQHHMPAEHYHFSQDHFLIPGLIDLHIHGAKGHDVMDGNPEALQAMSDALAAEGVTAYLATTMSADNNHIEAVLKNIAAVMPSQNGAKILGVHLEGPFISQAKMGAQRSDVMQSPNISLLMHWQKTVNGAIKLVTIAPELPDAQAFIHALRKEGMIVSVGHTNATYAETRAAINAGCTHATHLFNAMRGIHQREPGALGALLLASEVSAEIIVDGVHLHPAIVELAFRVKGKQQLFLVTDAMRAKCLGDGEYDLGGQAVLVRDQQATLADGTLAGSTLRMPQAIKNMVQYSRCSLPEAIHMASFNPAHMLGLAECKGSIDVDKDADLVVMNSAFEAQLTMREGKIVFKK